MNIKINKKTGETIVIILLTFGLWKLIELIIEFFKWILL